MAFERLLAELLGRVRGTGTCLLGWAGLEKSKLLLLFVRKCRSWVMKWMRWERHGSSYCYSLGNKLKIW